MPVMSTSSEGAAAAAAGVSASSASSAAWARACGTITVQKPAASNASARRPYDFLEFITLPVAQQCYDAKTSAQNCGRGIHAPRIRPASSPANGSRQGAPDGKLGAETSSGAGGRMLR